MMGVIASGYFSWQGRLAAGFVLALALLAVGRGGHVLAQDGGWSKPERVWGYGDQSDPPFMVADQNRTVHALSSRELAPGSVDIVYRNWNPTQGWSEPVDILLSPKKDIARLRGAMLDKEGYLHAVFFGGDQQDLSLYYAYSPAAAANRASAWSRPSEIAPFAGPIDEAAMVGDGDKRMVVVYTGSEDGLGAYSVDTLDGGLTWSQPVRFHQPANGQWPTHYGLYIDGDGRVHAAWADADQSGNGLLLYYARLDSPESTWTEPVVIDRLVDFEVDMPAIVEEGNELLMIYHSGFPTTRTMRRSLDHGRTWSEPERLFEQVGSDGPVQFVRDSSGALHAFFAGRIGSPAVHGLWATTYQAGRFTRPEPIASGPQVIDRTGDGSFDPQFARAVGIQGNEILVAWRQDPGLRGNGVWYSISLLDTPELPMKPLPTAIVSAPAGVTRVPTPLPPTPTPLPPVLSEGAPVWPNTTSVLSQSLMLAMLSTLGLVGIVLIIQYRKRGG